jgi:sialate O-acetylesterase
MVLQQNQPITLRGHAAPGAKVSVQLASLSGDISAQSDGAWSIILPPLPAGGPFELRVQSGAESLTLRDILIGEVWVCSGQSNMEWPISNAPDSAKILADADHPQIRLLKIPRIPHPEPPQHIDAQWHVCSPKVASDFSHVAYFFGLNLQRKLNVPIGLIDAARGGTPVEAWTPRENLLADPEMAPIFAKYEYSLTHEADLVAQQRELAKTWQPPTDPGNTRHAEGWADPATDISAWPLMTLPCWWQFGGLKLHGSVWFRKEIDVPSHLAGHPLTLHLGACDKTDITYFNNVQVGSIPIDLPDAWRTPRVYTIPGQLVRAGRNTIAVRVFCNVNDAGMTGPAKVMKITDGAWELPLAGPWHYQVEHNLGLITRPAEPWGPGHFHSPSILFVSMIEPLLVFRIRGVIWYQGESNQNVPQLYARLFPAMIRGWRAAWQQGDFPFLFVQLPNFGPEEPPQIFWTKLRRSQAVALDEPATGMAVTIDIGDANDLHPANKTEVGRRLALAAQSLAYANPDPSLLCPRVHSVALKDGTFRLTLQPGGTQPVINGHQAEGFTLAGKDGNFLPAQARIEGRDILVWSDEIQNPTALRYAWADNPRCNLANTAGLPLAPYNFPDES